MAAYDVIGQPPRTDLNEIVELAARLSGCPMATINVITEGNQHQVAAYGFDPAICRREDSMCAQIFEGPTPVVIADARTDPRFAQNPFVTGEIGNVRSYASHALRTPSGVAIGTLCVFGEEPRELSDDEVRGLGLLSKRVVDSLELWLRSRELADSNARLQDFASLVSHDLKTPLTTMSLSLELIDEQWKEDPESVEISHLLDRAVGATQRMTDYIDRHLEIASVDGCLRTGRVNLSLLVEEVLIDLAGAVGEVDVHVGHLPDVKGDPVQLRSVLQNFIDNAAKFHQGHRPATIEVRAVRLDSAWRIEVADNGSGLSDADLSRVFEAGARAHDQVAGTGLGLDTARRAVEGHAGRIGLEHNPGGGIVAWFQLPD